jgi:hypothetical protein
MRHPIGRLAVTAGAALTLAACGSDDAADNAAAANNIVANELSNVGDPAAVEMIGNAGDPAPSAAPPAANGSVPADAPADGTGDVGGDTGGNAGAAINGM